MFPCTTEKRGAKILSCSAKLSTGTGDVIRPSAASATAPACNSAAWASSRRLAMIAAFCASARPIRSPTGSRSSRTTRRSATPDAGSAPTNGAPSRNKRSTSSAQPISAAMAPMVGPSTSETAVLAAASTPSSQARWAPERLDSRQRASMAAIAASLSLRICRAAHAGRRARVATVAPAGSCATLPSRHRRGDRRARAWRLETTPCPSTRH